jgi:hypothetical protein
MTPSRPVLVGSGIALIGFVVVAVLLRLVRSGAFDFFTVFPDTAFYALLCVVLFAAILLIMNTPASRKNERRVRLEQPDSAETMARPPEPVDLPMTRGMTPRPVSIPEPPPLVIDRNVQVGAQNTFAGYGALAIEENHAAASAITASSPEEARLLARREELQERLYTLQQRADAAKVSFGLGRISSAGYRQYLREVEQERTLIESELMGLDE